MTLSFFTLERDRGDAYWFFGGLTFIKARGSQTGGQFAMIEQLAPAGVESPMHVHHGEEEMFYVLEGELEFFSGGEVISAGPGSYIFLPRDIPHGFRVTRGPARFLLMVTPAGFEDFVIEMGEPALELAIPPMAPPDMDKLMPLATKYRLDILGPLPVVG